MKPDASQRRTHDVDSLTAVAFGVFAGKGFDGASMDDVAAAAGVTKAAIYHHVPSKEALLERGLLHALDALFAVLAEREATEGRAAGRVRWIVRRVAALTPGLLPELSVLFRVRGNSPVERRAIERRREFDRIVAGLIAQAQHDGEIRADLDAGLIARLVFGMSNSVVEWYRPDGAIDADGLAEVLEGVVFGGIAAPAV